MVHTDTDGSMMLLTDIQEGHELLLDLLQLGRILLIGILQMLERTPWIDIVAWVDTHLLAVKGCHVGRMGREMYIGHKRCRIAVGLQLGRDTIVPFLPVVHPLPRKVSHTSYL